MRSSAASSTFDEMTRSVRPVDHANDLQPPPSQRTNGSVLEGIVERREHGVIVLSPATGRPFRRVIYTNSYGGEDIFEKIKAGLLPSHHLWGCFELARKGYEVAIVEPLTDFYLWRNPLPHDLKLLKLVTSWLGKDGIVYCGHNVLYWLPFLRRLGALQCHIVSLLFAREPLEWSRGHSGIIALNPAAAEQAHKLAPRAKVAHLGWGADLRVFPKIPFCPEWFLSCGITHRDHPTLSRAAARSRNHIRIVAPARPAGITFPENVTLVTNGNGQEAVPYPDLLAEEYGRCTAVLIVLKNDPIQYTGVGTTNLIEAMAMSRPVIVTRTGALPTELDVEKEGCGLFVPPNDDRALAEAIDRIASDPEAARRMGERGRALCESHYNIVRYADQLHEFFGSL